MSDSNEELAPYDQEGFDVSGSMGLPETRKIHIRIPRDARPGEWYPLNADRAETIASILLAISGRWPRDVQGLQDAKSPEE